jgi:predicted DNA-binding transcriptional regulator AlpA
MKNQLPTDFIVDFDELPDSAFVRLNQLLSTELIPFSASTTWRRVREGTFPQPIRVSPQVTAWRVGEIREWAKCPGTFIVGHREPKQKSGKGCAA